MVKMGSGPLADWIQVYDDHMEKIWRNERKELRNLAMLHYAYNKEVTRLKGAVDNQFEQIKSAVIKKDNESNKRKKFAGLAQSEKFDIECIDLYEDYKENKTKSVPSAHKDLSEIKTEDLLIESPDTHAFICRSPSPQTPDIAIVTSPVLRKSSFRKNVSTSAIPNPLSCVESKRKNLSSPSVLNPFLFDDTAPSKRKKPNEPVDSDSKQKEPSGSSNLIPFVIQKTPKVEAPTPAPEYRTPKIFDETNIMESSVIEDTPEMKSLRKSKRSRLKSKLNKTNQSNTLTQMFLKPAKIKKEFDSKMNSMTVTEMLNLINDSSGSETEAELDQSDETIDGLEVSDQAECSKAQDRTADAKNRSDIRDKCHPSPTKSPKNANKTNLRSETYDGFWDLTFGPTPKSLQEESMILNLKKS